MPPIVASLFCLGFIAWLYRRDLQQRPNVTNGLWVPTIWFLILGSRSFGQWLVVFGIHVGGGGGTMEEGSPVDAAFYFAMILAGMNVLSRRRPDWGAIIRHNRWLFLFLLYCFVSIVWSDFPFVSFKRWIKILGHPIMALIIFTEPDPVAALTQLMKRAAYVLLPVSLLFIKYYPQFGRGFDPNGQATNIGITTDKNSLGCICLILGYFFVWHLLRVRQWERGADRSQELKLCGFFWVLVAWLFHFAHSMTSLVTMLLDVGVMLVLAYPRLNLRRLGTYVVVLIIAGYLANSAFDLYAKALAVMGKDPTLTDRTEVWQHALAIPNNPVLGAGFESFWLGERLEKMWSYYWWHPIQAHNGYIETYLNLGLLGVGIMLMTMVSTFQKGARMLFTNFDFARFRLGFLAGFVFYNVTEAAFKALHPVWFVFYLIAIDLPKPETDEVAAGEEPVNELENAPVDEAESSVV